LDNFCHTLVGAACGEAGLKHKTRFANATLMIAANLPDVDVLSFFTDTDPISFRRGWTHGVVAQLTLPLVLTAVMYAWGRLRPAYPPEGGLHTRGRLRPPNSPDGLHARGPGLEGRSDARPPLRVGWLLLLSYVGVYSHVFLDFLNNYGIRVLAPLDWRWFYGDTLFIADVWLWLVLGVGVWLSRRQHRPGPSRAGLVFASLYIALMLTSAQVARTVVSGIWRDVHGAEPRALMVGPLPFTPFTRTVIVDAGNRYDVGTFRWWPTTVTFGTEQIVKNSGQPLVKAAREAPPIREFLVWARFPYWTMTRETGGTRVTVGDVRFMSRSIRRANFQTSVLIPDP
jgi:inner membrane protein